MPVAAIPLLILLVPIFDTTFVSVTRRMAGRSPMLGGRDHLSHRLVALGIDERRAVHRSVWPGRARRRRRGDACSDAEVGYAAILIAPVPHPARLASAIVLGHVEAHAAEADRGAPPLVAELAYRNRVYEVLLDVSLIALAVLRRVPLPVPGAGVRRLPAPLCRLVPAGHCVPDRGLALAGKYRQVWRSVGTAS